MFHLCQVAFRKLVHVNSDTLLHAASDERSSDVLVSTVKLHLSSKKALLLNWIEEQIRPDCSMDEVDPTLYLRCEKFATIKQVLKAYNEHLSKKYEDSSPLSFCSLSTMRRTFADYRPCILWGDSQVRNSLAFFLFLTT